MTAARQGPATAGTTPTWRPGQAMVDARVVLTAVQGLGSRFHQVVSPRGAAQSRGWRAAAALAAVGDLLKARRLASHDRFHLAPRLVLDAADLAVWCLAARDDTDTSEDAVIPGVPLAAEAAARMGAAGLVVPAVNAAVAATVRARRGHQLRLEQFSWQLMGTVGGWAVRRTAERRKRRIDRSHADELAARLHQAELAGLHDVIVRHEGAMDLLQRATALVDLTAPGASRRHLAGAVKAAVADMARGRATYLGDTLATWQADHNLRRELQGMVTLQLAPGMGTVLLSDGQARLLRERLDELDPTGPVTVGMVVPESPGAFGPRTLSIGPDVLELPADRPEVRWVFDATPVAFLMDLGWLAQPTGAHREAVPWSATAGPMAGALAAALWAARRADRNRSINPHHAVAASAVITLAYTVGATTRMRNPHTDSGVSRFPWVMALQGYELVRGISAEEQSAGTRALGLAGTAAILAAGWSLSPRPRSARALVAELNWVAGFDLFTRTLRQATVRSAEEVTEAAAAEDARHLEAAYGRGQQRARAIIGEALSSATLDLSSRADQLPSDIRDEARRRLAEVEALLAGDGPGDRSARQPIPM